VIRALRPAGRLALVLGLLGGLLALLAWRAPPRADLVGFLPPGRTPATAFLFREIQSGAATTLLLAAIEGDVPREELARLSRETAAGLRASGRFAFVGDGTTRLSEAEQAVLFRYRYLLSPETRTDAFTAAALRQQMEALLDGLRSSACSRASASRTRPAPSSASPGVGSARRASRQLTAPGSLPRPARRRVCCWWRAPVARGSIRRHKAKPSPYSAPPSRRPTRLPPRGSC
jgi:hypothetical protein